MLDRLDLYTVYKLHDKNKHVVNKNQYTVHHYCDQQWD